MSLSIALMGLLAMAAPAEAVEVRYVATVVTQSWEPIALKDVQRVVEAAVKEPLTAPGQMALKKVPVADLRGGDYSLRISGRFVEEAERFTVYLSFGPGTQEDLPTLFAADTSEPLGRKSRAEMLKRIRAAATRAATRLSRSLTPWLIKARRDVSPALSAPTLPMNWGEIEVPSVSGKRKAIRTLMDPRQPDNARAKAVVALKGDVFDQQAARNAVEFCVLRDPASKVRQACVNALAPKARSHVPTQRILLHALRTDVDDGVLGTLIKVSKGFVGLSRMETIATWLHMVASDATPTRAAEKVASLLIKEKNVPNLEFAVAACLQQEAVVYGKRGACAQGLLRKIPAARRRPVVWKFLQETSVFGSGQRRAYEGVLKNVMEDRKAPPDQELSLLMLELAERPATGRLRHKVLRLAGQHAPANPETVRRLLAVGRSTRHARDAISAAVVVVQRNPALAEGTAASLQALTEAAPWYPRPSRSNPFKEAKKAQKRLKRIIAKRDKK